MLAIVPLEPEENPNMFWDRNSFEDSDRFDADESICSWTSGQESVCNNWRGWKRSRGSSTHDASSKRRINRLNEDGKISSLIELTTNVIAIQIPFGTVEHFYPPVPELLQQRIAFWSFPQDEEDIRLYACLANGSSDEYQRAENLVRQNYVRDILQIGFHLSATVMQETLTVSAFKVAITFDRRRITSCSCTCNAPTMWCQHVVAVCLYRIIYSDRVCLRAPVSESIHRLKKPQLRKFAQYLISELPQIILPTAQRLLDELLSSQQAAINTIAGAPDPTAGAAANEQTSWCLDESRLHSNIKKILLKQCTAAPTVYSDVNYLNTTAPPATSEFSQLLRPLRGREPEGMWNLLSIVREMLRRRDYNAISLLDILTHEIVSCDQIVLWWFQTKASLYTGITLNSSLPKNSNTNSNSQYACSSFCDETIVLWRLAALNPQTSSLEKSALYEKLNDWHTKVLSKVMNAFPIDGPDLSNKDRVTRRSNIESFPGFKSAMEACLVDWDGCQCLCDGKQLDEQIYNLTSGTNQTEDSLNAKKSRPAKRKKSSSAQPKASTSKSCELLADCSSSSLEPQLDAEPQPSTSRDCHDQLHVQAGAQGPQDAFEIVHDMSKNAAATNKLEDYAPNDQPEVLIKNVTKSLMNSLAPDEANSDSSLLKVNAKKPTDTIEVLFARAEGLQAHGYTEGACLVAVRLAELLIESPLTFDATIAQQHQSLNECPKEVKRSKRARKTLVGVHQTLLATEALNKVIFMCNVLRENLQHRNIAFRVGLYGLEIARFPASTKPLEVKLINQEQDLVNLLKQIPLTDNELSILRDLATEVRDGHYNTGEALIPLLLAGYIFDALVLTPAGARQPQPAPVVHHAPQDPSGSSGVQSSSSSDASSVDSYSMSSGSINDKPPPVVVSGGSLTSDEQLGFEAAVVALGLKTNVSEADHPLLCEGIRRQRGDLALTLLCHYKDNQEKLNLIIDRLLDKDVHRLYKESNSGPSYSVNQLETVIDESTPVNDAGASTSSAQVQQPQQPNLPESDQDPANLSNNEFREASPVKSGSGWERHFEQSTSGGDGIVNNGANIPDSMLDPIDQGLKDEEASNQDHIKKEDKQILPGVNLQQSTEQPTLTSSESGDSLLNNARNEIPLSHMIKSMSLVDTSNDSTSEPHEEPSAPLDVGAGPSSDIAIDESNVICSTNDNVKPEAGPSTANAPVSQLKPAAELKPELTRDSSQNDVSQQADASLASTPSHTGNNVNGNPPSSGNGNRRRKRAALPSMPNQPSEASAHFMFELAKSVLVKAGGSNSAADIFDPRQPNSQNGFRAPHRRLHICALQIALYALGLHNRVSPNWLSRTYSSHVSWIHGQAIELGLPAIKLLIDTWEGHLTPKEVASLADRAGRGQNVEVHQAAAQLALSCLKYAHVLTKNEIQRALIQHKEQSNEMLERACLAVENAAKGGGVSPDVLFLVAHTWYQLYEESGVAADLDTTVAPYQAQQQQLSQHHNQQALPVNETSVHWHPVANQQGINTAQQHQQMGAPAQPRYALPWQSGNQYPDQSGGLIQPLLHWTSAPGNIVSTGHPIYRPSQRFGQVPVVAQQDCHHPQRASTVSNATGAPYPLPDVVPYNHYPGCQYTNQSYASQVQEANQMYANGANNQPGSHHTMYPYNSHQGPSSSGFGYGGHQQHQHHYAAHAPPVTSNSQEHAHYINSAQHMPRCPFICGAARTSCNCYQQNETVVHGAPVPPAPPMGVVHPQIPGPYMHHYAAHPMTSSNHYAHHVYAPPANSNGVNTLSSQDSLTTNYAPYSAYYPLPNPQAQGSQQQQPQQPPPSSMAPHYVAYGSSSARIDYINYDYPISAQVPSSSPSSSSSMTNNMVVLDSQASSSTMQPSNSQSNAATGDKQQQNSTSGLSIKRTNGESQAPKEQRRQSNYLYAAYRVGMMALETLNTGTHEASRLTKFSKNPPYGDDVMWLLAVAKKLGIDYLNEFSLCAIKSITNPFTLANIIEDISRGGPSLAPVHRSSISPGLSMTSILMQLINRCQYTHSQCAHFKMKHIVPSDYDEYASLLTTARSIFALTGQEGVQRYNDLLNSLLKSSSRVKACRPELSQMISAMYMKM